jgi:cellulose synthase/poly-beta-1,6-N-acetylglucosamine synthase-like glycosyltransferase
MEWIIIVYLLMFFFGIYFLLMFLLIYRRYKKDFNTSPEPVKFPSITFIVPAFNEEEGIEETLGCLVKLGYPQGKKKILVVNDGSTDRTSEIVRKFIKEHPEVRLIDKRNSGKADSINQAIKTIDTELIAITDADSFPQKDCLLKMVGYFEEDENIGAVTSRVLIKNKKNLLERWQDLDYTIIAWSRKVLDYIDSVYVTNGPLSIYRTSIINKVGGFDSKNLTEDIEITWRLLSQGYKTKMAYSAKVYTTVPSKFKKWSNQRIRWNLGGLQTIFKYRKNILRGTNFFGFFVIPYVTLAFFLSLIGIFLLLRYLWLKISFFILSLPFLIKGYNPINLLEFDFHLTLLIILGGMFMIFTLIYYRSAVKDSDIKRLKLRSLFSYIFIYRPLYLIPLVVACFRLAKGDIRWYTK